MEKIEIFTDGSSLGNPGPGGFAALIRLERKEIVAKGSKIHTTNNRMELQAVIAGLQKIPLSADELKHIPIFIFSDSRLVIETMRKGWKKKTNHDLWETLENLCAKKQIFWHWVKGHDTHPENIRVDKIANAEALKMQKKNKGTAKGTQPAQNSKVASFFCQNCKKSVRGKLKKLASNSLIRADCELCGKFIKFAKHTKETLKRAESSQAQILF